MTDYAGDVTPDGCWTALGDTGGPAALIDVRTRPEWIYVGVPQLEDSMQPLIVLEWQSYPDMQVAPDFVDQLGHALTQRSLDQDARLYFLCRSGVRSLAAARAMSAAGYKRSFNVTGGFEGDMNREGHRGTVNGWKVSGLPWAQR